MPNTDHLKAMLERARLQGREDGLREAVGVVTAMADTYGAMPSSALRQAVAAIEAKL